MTCESNADGKLSEKKMEEEDSLRTVECLRGRLLAERVASRNAKEEAEIKGTKVCTSKIKPNCTKSWVLHCCPYNYEVTGSRRENRLLQKYKVKLRTIDPRGPTLFPIPRIAGA
ncbi:uncharacterized protein [Nicotiana tomentosiformis]|uniref:uncharacterized protein isoform X1 n=1 Tax=Nicotiana tomentosiformis TaxID=4098 RepID=UPI00051B163D|nr:uncharacterized protein LOC117274266 isoform X1 [Nicotiana tomentosiformis]